MGTTRPPHLQMEPVRLESAGTHHSPSQCKAGARASWTVGAGGELISSKKPRAVLIAGCPSLLPLPRAGLMAGCPGGLSPSWSVGRSGLSQKPPRARVTHNAGTALSCEQALSLQLLGGGLPGDKGVDPGLEVGNMPSPPPAATPWTRRGRWLNPLGCRGAQRPRGRTGHVTCPRWGSGSRPHLGCPQAKPPGGHRRVPGGQLSALERPERRGTWAWASWTLAGPTVLAKGRLRLLFWGP